MTSNVNKVLNCLIEKRLSDMQCGATSHGWMTIKDIAAQCGFEKNGTAVGCVVILMNKGVVETNEDTTLDGKTHKYYRIRDDANLTVTYSFSDEIIAKKEIVW